MTSLRETQETASALLRRYPAAAPGERTEILRAVASTLIEAREHFFTADGEVDYRGRTYAYRRLVGEIFAGANLPPDEISTVQAAVRYHVGNLLRDRLDPTTISDLGLRAESPKTRSAEKRTAEGEALRVLRGGVAFTTGDEVLEALRLAQALLARVDTDAVRNMPEVPRRAVAEAVAVLEPLVAAVVAAADHTSARHR